MSLEGIPIGTAMAMFTENLTSAVMVLVAKNVFPNQLKTNSGIFAPAVDASAVVAGGATEIRDSVPQGLYHAVLFAYKKAW